MTGSMYASIAGLKAHMQKLTVIGNNVANVNTTAYKTQRTVFRNSVYAMYTSGSNGSEVVGGKNPSQLGYGSLVANIDLNMSSATYNPGNPMDCAIVGDGFFMVGDKEQQSVIDPTDPTSFKSLMLSRVGDFGFKADGFLTDGQGNCVYGFQCTGIDKTTGKPIVSDQLVPIRLPRMKKTIIDSTTGLPVENPGDDVWVNATTKDELKDGYEWGYEVKYPVDKQTGDDGTQYIALRDYNPNIDEVDENADPKPDPSVNPLSYAELETITIDSETGCITGLTKEGGINVTVGYIALGSVTNPNGVTHIGQSYYRCDAGAGELRVTTMGGVHKQLGLSYVNGSLYNREDDTANPEEDTGLPEGSAITSAGKVSLMTGFLEAPNVDLATEISELITTQRGYQANTRIVTVTDSMLEELVNMKR